jgi:hypothetical protein
MFDTPTELTIIVTAVVLWFAHGTYLNIKLKEVHDKLDKVLDNFNGLREYLYEIDPQFDDERKNWETIHEGDYFEGEKPREFLKQKKESGARTLQTLFTRGQTTDN